MPAMTQDAPTLARPQRGWFLRTLGIPLAAWLLARVVMALAQMSVGIPVTSAASHVYADAGLYLNVANNGYTLVPVVMLDSQGNEVIAWEGNAGWMPLYPLLIRGVAWTGLEATVGAVLIAMAAHLGWIAATWNLILKRQMDPAGLLTLACMALFPCFTYHGAVFPISLLMLETVLTAWAVEKRNWPAAMLLCMAAAATYSTGWLLAPAAGLVILLQRDLPWRERILRPAFLAFAGVAGLAFMFALARQDTKVWNAYFLVQEKYGHDVQNPLDAFHWVYASVIAPLKDRLWRMQIIYSQMPLVFVLVLLSAYVAVRNWGKTPVAVRVLLTTATVGLVVPLSLGGVLPWRPIALAAPVMLVWRNGRPWALGVALVVFAVLGYFTAQAYFTGGML